MENASTNLPRRRRRPPKSCQSCRSRKVKCDLRGPPCGPCARARVRTVCSYQPDGDAGNASGDNRLGSCHIPGVELIGAISTSDHLTGSAHTGLSPTIGKTGGPDLVSEQANEIRDLKARLRRLERMQSSGEQPAAFLGPDGTTHVIDPLLSTDDPSLPTALLRPNADKQASPRRLKESQPQLRIDSEKTKLFGKSHWVNGAGQIFELIGVAQYDPEQIDLVVSESELAQLTRENVSLRKAIKKLQYVELNEPVPDLKGTIPPRSVCDDLVQHYLKTFEVLYRLFHTPTFKKEYEQFWDNGMLASTNFIMKLVLILSIGTTFYDKEREKHRRLARTWIYAAQWWLTGPTEKSTMNPDGLQVMCLLLIAHQATALSRSTSLSTGSLLDMALAMGFQHDPDTFPLLTPFQTIIRRQLWLTVLELAIYSSLDSALPLLISKDDFDTQLPANLDDDDIELSLKEAPKPKPNTTFTDSSTALILAQSLQLRLRVVRFINGMRNYSSYDEVIKLGEQLRDACRSSTTFFSTHMEAHGDRQLRPTRFHRGWVDMHLRRLLMILHRPFMLKAKKEPRYEVSRKMCLESAMTIASYAGTLALPTEVVDELSMLAINGAGIVRGAFGMDVITLLGVELIMQLEEERTNSPLPAPLAEMARATRAPILRVLRNMSEHLRRVIENGIPSTKRFHFVSLILGQVEALDVNESAERLVAEKLKSSLQTCIKLMRAHLAASTPQDSVNMLSQGFMMEPQGHASFNPSEFTDPQWDLTDLLAYPGFGMNNSFWSENMIE